MDKHNIFMNSSNDNWHFNPKKWEHKQDQHNIFIIPSVSLGCEIRLQCNLLGREQFLEVTTNFQISYNPGENNQTGNWNTNTNTNADTNANTNSKNNVLGHEQFLEVTTNFQISYNPGGWEQPNRKLKK